TFMSEIIIYIYIYLALTTTIYTLSLHDALPICDRGQVADPGDRGHSFPAEVRVRGDRGRVRGGAGETGQHQEVRRSGQGDRAGGDRKSTRLNSSHVKISYAVFCLKKKKKKHIHQ